MLRPSATSTGVSIQYTGDGVRVSETVAGITTQYLVDENNPTGYAQVIEELRGGQVQTRYTYGHDLISQTMVGAGATSFYTSDGLGSVRALTNSAGSVTDRYAYDAFGSALATTGSTAHAYRFTGAQQDAALGMYYLRARYYQPGSGRFWTRDTYPVEIQSSRELNRYSYVTNDPINAIDPSGLISIAASQGLIFSKQALKDAAIIIATGLAVACIFTLSAQQLGMPLEGPCTVYAGVMQVQGQDIRGNQDNVAEDSIRGGAWMMSIPWYLHKPLTARQGRQMLATLIYMLDLKQRGRRSEAYREAVDYINRCAAGGGCLQGGSWHNKNLPKQYNEARIDIVIGRGITFVP